MSAVLRDEWHANRAKNIGGSEVAALFGLSPYMSRWTLWQIKSGHLPAPDIDSDRVRWGTRLESAIAQGLAEDHDWKIRKVHRYINHPTVRGMGANLDFEIIDHADGAGVLEIKNVDGMIFRQKWQDLGDKVEAPMHIELQLQHQLSVSGRQWGAIGVLVGGNEAKTTVRQRHDKTINKIETAVDEFWWSIEKGKEPPIEDTADLALVASLFDGSKTVKLESLELEHLCQEMKTRQEAAKAASKQVDETKLKIITLLDQHEAEVAIGQSYKVSFKEQTKKEHTVKESTFRVLRVSEIKGE